MDVLGPARPPHGPGESRAIDTWTTSWWSCPCPAPARCGGGPSLPRRRAALGVRARDRLRVRAARRAPRVESDTGGEFALPMARHAAACRRLRAGGKGPRRDPRGGATRPGRSRTSAPRRAFPPTVSPPASCSPPPGTGLRSRPTSTTRPGGLGHPGGDLLLSASPVRPASPCIARTPPTAPSTSPSPWPTATCSSSRAATTGERGQPQHDLYYLNVLAGRGGAHDGVLRRPAAPLTGKPGPRWPPIHACP